MELVLTYRHAPMAELAYGVRRVCTVCGTERACGVRREWTGVGTCSPVSTAIPTDLLLYCPYLPRPTYLDPTHTLHTPYIHPTYTPYIHPTYPDSEKSLHITLSRLYIDPTFLDSTKRPYPPYLARYLLARAHGDTNGLATVLSLPA